MAARTQTKAGWPVEAMDPPSLTAQQWNVAGLLGIILIVMAILQLISFSDFKGWLASIGLSGPAVWGAAIVFCEVLGAASFFKIKLSYFGRMASAWLAILAGGFWFYENLRLVSNGKAGGLSNSGLFGRFLHQSPGWWTVIEVAILLFWIVYALEIGMGAAARRR